MTLGGAAAPGPRLLAAVLLSACVGVAGGGLSAWAVYQHVGPTQTVVTQTKTGGGSISIGDIAAAVQPSLVTIGTASVSAPDLASGRTVGIAQGFAVSADGLIVTAAQEVRGATRLRVAAGDGRAYDASIAATDVADGIVILRAAGASGLPALRFAAAAPRIGDVAVVVSSTLRGALQTRSGVIATVGGAASDGATTVADVLEVDSITDPGAGGAPLVDSAGNVTGIVFVATGQPGVTAASGRDAAALIASLGAGGGTTPTFGVTSQVIGPAASAATGLAAGALVESVDPAGPAAALLQPGDIVTAVNGISVSLATPLEPSSFDLSAGQRATLTVVGSAGATRSVVVTVGSG
ncbi:MAG: S1C family serine protease [Candidatus Dormibacteria bacterium]